MQSIRCHLCSTSVWVEKYSEQHTSIQWPAADDSACTMVAEPLRNGPGVADRSCPALRRTIDMAVDAGEIPLTRRAEPVSGTIGVTATVE